jgi:serine/threonine protein kinase
MTVGQRYQLLSRIGAGGMGVVYKALDRLTGNQIALKRIALSREPSLPGSVGGASGEPAGPSIDPTLGFERTMLGPVFSANTVAAYPPSPQGSVQNDELLRLGLAQEFRTLASLRHPHIISVLDYGFDSDQQPYFTMELLCDAAPLLEGGQKLPRPQRFQLLLQLLNALMYLHRRGVLHRDIKPAGIAGRLFRR